MRYDSKEKNILPEKETPFDFEGYQKKVVAGLMGDEGLLGENGLLKPLIANFVEAALEAELSAHLEAEKANETAAPNKRNGR